MIIIKFEEIFPYEKFPVEYKCYQQFKNEDVDNINYLAVPWTQILNSGWLNFPNRKPTIQYFQELQGIRLPDGNNITVCQHDDYMQLLPLFSHMNINKVFSPLHNVDNKQTWNIEIIPIAFTCAFEFDTTKERDIYFSFVGTTTSHPIRTRMGNRIKGPGIIYRDSYHVDSNFFFVENYKQNKEEEFKSILERSRFSLCPRGSSPSSVRFWESLAAGAIPILISDNWALPDWDWDNTIVKISEELFEVLNYDGILSVLNRISPDKEKMMRQNCLDAYSKLNQDNYKQYILENSI